MATSSHQQYLALAVFFPLLLLFLLVPLGSALDASVGHYVCEGGKCTFVVGEGATWKKRFVAAPAAGNPPAEPADKIEVAFNEEEVSKLLTEFNLSKMFNAGIQRRGKRHRLQNTLYLSNTGIYPLYKMMLVDSASPIGPVNKAMQKVREDMAANYGLKLDLKSTDDRFRKRFWVYDVMLFRAFLELFSAVLKAAEHHEHFLEPGTGMLIVMRPGADGKCPITGCSHKEDLSADEALNKQNIEFCTAWYDPHMLKLSKEQQEKWDAFMGTYLPGKFVVKIADPPAPAEPAPAPAEAPAPAPAPAPAAQKPYMSVHHEWSENNHYDYDHDDYHHDFPPMGRFPYYPRRGRPHHHHSSGSSRSRYYNRWDTPHP